MNSVHDKSRFQLVQLDVTNVDHVKRVYDTIEETLNSQRTGVRHLHAVINNAGISEFVIAESGEALDVDIYSKHLQVNYLSVVRLTKLLLPLIRRCKGRIVNISSTAGRYPSHSYFLTAYSPSKAALSNFTENLNEELRHTGVKVISIEPFTYKTGMTSSKAVTEATVNSFQRCTDEAKKVYKSQVTHKLSHFVNAIDLKGLIPENHTDVVDAIVEAISAYEPNAVYTLAPASFNAIYLMLIFLPTDMATSITRFLCTLNNLLYGTVRSLPSQ